MSHELSREDLLSLIDLAAECVRARTYSDLVRVVDDLGAVFSFEKAALCAIAASEGTPSLVHFVNHSYGERWASAYTTRGYAAVDPVLRHALTATAPFAWRESFRPCSGPLSDQFLEAARDSGLVDGVAFGCTPAGPSSLRTVASFAIHGANDWARARHVLAVVGPHLLEAYGRLPALAGESRAHESLTAREREVLSWARQGKTYWEIGCILGISERTVKFHFARIKERLDVVTACHAVAKAMGMGLIA